MTLGKLLLICNYQFRKKKTKENISVQITSLTSEKKLQGMILRKRLLSIQLSITRCRKYQMLKSETSVLLDLHQ
jgi:hypothetical protein